MREGGLLFPLGHPSPGCSVWERLIGALIQLWHWRMEEGAQHLRKQTCVLRYLLSSYFVGLWPQQTSFGHPEATQIADTGF